MRNPTHLQPLESYGSLEELRRDKRRLSKQIRKSMTVVQEGVKQSLFPASPYISSSSKYVRFVGYGLTAWNAAKTVNRFVNFFKRK